MKRLLLCIFFLLFANMAYAEAPSSGRTYVIRSAMDNNYVVDAYWGANQELRENIQLYHYHGGNNQQFVITSVGNGWYKIVCVINNKAVDVAGGVAGDEINVQLWDQNGTAAQCFKFENAGGGYYYIKNKLGYYLDVYWAECRDEANIQTCRKNGGNNQKWLLTSVTGKIPNNDYGATLSYRTITLGNFSTFDEWSKEMRIAESSAIGLSNHPIHDPVNGNVMTDPLTGTTAEEGYAIVGLDILSYKTIKMPAPNALPDPNKLPKNYNWRSNSPIPISAYGNNTVKVQLPKKIKFTLHKHNYKNSVFFTIRALQVTTRCSCGFSYTYEWELPLPNLKGDREAVYKTVYRELPR